MTRRKWPCKNVGAENPSRGAAKGKDAGWEQCRMFKKEKESHFSKVYELGKNEKKHVREVSG